MCSMIAGGPRGSVNCLHVAHPLHEPAILANFIQQQSWKPAFMDMPPVLLRWYSAEKVSPHLNHIAKRILHCCLIVCFPVGNGNEQLQLDTKAGQASSEGALHHAGFGSGFGIGLQGLSHRVTNALHYWALRLYFPLQFRLM